MCTRESERNNVFSIWYTFYNRHFHFLCNNRKIFMLYDATQISIAERCSYDHKWYNHNMEFLVVTYASRPFRWYQFNHSKMNSRDMNQILSSNSVKALINHCHWANLSLSNTSGNTINRELAKPICRFSYKLQNCPYYGLKKNIGTAISSMVSKYVELVYEPFI